MFKCTRNISHGVYIKLRFFALKLQFITMENEQIERKKHRLEIEWAFVTSVADKNIYQHLRQTEWPMKKGSSKKFNNSIEFSYFNRVYTFNNKNHTLLFFIRWCLVMLLMRYSVHTAFIRSKKSINYQYI